MSQTLASDGHRVRQTVVWRRRQTSADRNVQGPQAGWPNPEVWNPRGRSLMTQTQNFDRKPAQ
jgi:hypothetical protein